MPACEKLEVFLKDRIISKNLWPPRSPDFTPADFFLWGLLKGKVYKNTPRTIEQLKDDIRQEIQAVNADNLGKVFQNECGSLSPRHGASSGCGWRNGLQYGG